MYQTSEAEGNLIIECRDYSDGLKLFVQPIGLKIDIPGVSDPLDVCFRSNTLSSDGHSSLILQAQRTPCWFSRSKPIRIGRFGVINFAHYWMGHPKNLNFELSAIGWKAQFCAVIDDLLDINRGDEYKITHWVEFSREDGSNFSDEEAQDFLWKLSIFLSFCRGQWINYCLMTGFDDSGEKVLEQWGTGRVSIWRQPNGWLDEHSGQCICELYSEFSIKVEDASWLETIANVVYWFTRADTSNVGSDGACILLQAALERLAWQIIVRERNAISPKEFQDLTAADQLRLMLNILSIPTTIPETLARLKSLGLSRGLDGPSVFTYIRNRLTHPPKISASTEKLPYYEACVLAQWYVELAILAACGYTGKYGNRTVIPRWVGQVEAVPWACAG